MTDANTKISAGISAPRAPAFIVYINGIEVPAKSVSLRYGVWQVPEMSVEMVADPVLVRLGAEDRIQVAVFYLDDCDVAPGVEPAFRLFGEGEITAWGYKNTTGNRSIVFSVVNQIQIFSQLFVQFMTTLDDMVGHATGPADVTGYSNASNQLVYPYALFNQGLVPGVGQAPARITKPFDYLYNAVRGMMAANVPDASRTIPAANFFTRWARLTNFHNRFAASPFFDESTDAAVFPVLRAMQNVAGIDVVIKNLIPQLQNTGSIWDMLQTVYSTMLMEIAMIPGMPLVSVDLASNLVTTTDFSEHKLVLHEPPRGGPSRWIPALSDASRKTKPKRLQNYFPKQQMLFSIPPSCNAVFPSQVLNFAYEEVFATQPTRLYFNDETVSKVIKIPQGGTNETIMNSLSIAYPPEADLINHARGTAHPKFNGKNLLLYPEEFYKGPVMDRRTVPPWLFFLKSAENKKTPGVSDSTSQQNQAVPPARTGTPTPPKPDPGQAAVNPTTPDGHLLMVTQSDNGRAGPSGRVYVPGTELLRDRVAKALLGTAIPLDYALTWINVESGGNRHEGFDDLVNKGAGYFQFTAEECASFRSRNFPRGIEPRALVDFPDTKTADATCIQAGIDYILHARQTANQFAASLGLSWSEADMWRLTKFRTHGLPGYAKAILPQVKAALGHAPKDWEEFYFEAHKTAQGQSLRALNNATALGVIPGASGWMISKSDKTPFNGGAASPAPVTVNNVASTRADEPAAPAGPEVTPAQRDALSAANEDVYHLYAKFEYFRERYAKRSGSASVVWNPYVVPGFPGAIFDSRASRVDLMIYITTVQHQLSHSGQCSTTLSYLYGRQFQEMFDTLSLEFSKNDNEARGSAPQEPVRDVSKIVQSFSQAEQYYQRLFYGAQPLYGKAAAFDFREFVAYAPEVPGGEPVPIFITGPDAGSDDVKKSAEVTADALIKTRDKVHSTLLDVQARIATQEAIVKAYPRQASADPDNEVTTVWFTQQVDADAALLNLRPQLALLQSQMLAIDAGINIALKTVEANANNTDQTRVEHNLDGTRELVPTAAGQSLFDNRDAAMRYNWRPICTLDEYIVFYNSAGEGPIPAFGHARSVGARYYDRIRTMTPPTEDFIPPTDIDGLRGAAVSGLSSQNFPQIRADWDKALLAYKNNVLSVKAPRI